MMNMELYFSNKRRGWRDIQESFTIFVRILQGIWLELKSKLVFSKQIWQLSILCDRYAGDVMRMHIFVEQFSYCACTWLSFMKKIVDLSRKSYLEA